MFLALHGTNITKAKFKLESKNTVSDSSISRIIVSRRLGNDNYLFILLRTTGKPVHIL